MDNPKPPSPPHASEATTTGRHSSATTSNPTLENVRSLLLRCAIDSTPEKSLTPLQKTFVEKRIQEFFPTIYTPDHPPYAWMVENAIKELNEEGGSTEDAISKFIVQKYKELPFAHAAFLKHHLRKLCESGNLVETRSHCYLTVKPTITNRASNRHPSATSLALSTIRPPSPSPSPSSSYSPTYASSSTSSSCQSFNLKKKRGKRKKSYRTQRGRGKGRGKGRGRGRGRGRGKRGGRIGGRGRGRGRGRGGEPSLENMIEVYADKVEDEVHVPQIQYLTGDDEMANESFQGKEQPQARGNVENRAEQSTMVIEIESPEQEYRFNEERAQPLQLEKVGEAANSPITEVCLINDDAKASEWLTYDFLPLVKANRIDGEYGYFGGLEQEDDDVLDELIEEVYVELVEASQIDDQAPEHNLQNPDNHLVQASQESINVECRAGPSTLVIAVEMQQQEHMVSEEKMKKECSKVWLQQIDVMGGNVLQTGEQSRRKGDGGEDIETREMQHKINHQTEQTCETNDLQPQDQLNVGDLELDGEKEMCDGDCPSMETGEQSQRREDGGEDIETREMQHKITHQAEETNDLQPEDQLIVGDLEVDGEKKMCDGYSPSMETGEQSQRKEDGGEDIETREMQHKINHQAEQTCEKNDFQPLDQLNMGDLEVNRDMKMCDGDCPLMETGEQSQRKEDGGEDIEIREMKHKINHQAEQICETNDLQLQGQLIVGDLEVDGEKKMCDGDCPTMETGELSQRKEDGGEDIEIREMQHKINHQDEQTCETNDRQPQGQLNVGDLEVDGEKKMCEGDCPATEECHDIKKSSDASTEVKPVEDSSTLQSTEKLNQTRQLRPRPPKFQPDQTKGQFGRTRLEKNQETDQHYNLRSRLLATKPQLRKRSSKTQK